MFKEIGDSSIDAVGMLIDDISLTCDPVALPPPDPSPNITNSSVEIITNESVETTQVAPSSYLSDIMRAIAISLSIPINQFRGLRYLYLLMEDLWLYNYDKVDYGGTIFIVFNTTATIESLKFLALDNLFHWQSSSDSLPLSDYKPYTTR